MIRRNFIILTTIIALVAFATGAFIYQHQKQKQETERASAQFSILERAHSPTMGPSTAPVTIVEFFDPACESCRAFYPYVKDILAAYPRDVRLVIRYTPFHGEPSIVGVQILEAARQQQRFEPVIEALLASQPEWADHNSVATEKAWESSRAAGLDLNQARDYLATGAVGKLLEQEIADIKAVGIQGTPTFFVNGKPLTKLDPDVLHEMVKAEVTNTKTTQWAVRSKI